MFVDLNLPSQPPALTPPFTQGQPNASRSIAVTGGSANYNEALANVVPGNTNFGAGNFSFTAGTGVALISSTGLTATNATTPATATFTLNASDSSTPVTNGSGNYTVTVNPPLALSTASLPAGDINVPYNQTITVSLGTPGYIITGLNGYNAGTTGLAAPSISSVNSSNDTITISSIPTGVGNGSSGMPATFTLTATDVNGAFITQAYTINVNPALTITPPTLIDGDAGVNFTRTITVGNGPTGPNTFPYTYGSTSFSDPNGTGLTLSAFNPNSGIITLSATKPKAGTVTFTISVTDNAGGSATNSYSVNINPALSIAPPSPFILTPADVNFQTIQTITVSNGTKPYTLLTATPFNGGGTGLSLSNISINPSAGTVTLNGTPTAPGSVSFTVNCTDNAGGTINPTVYTLTVNPAVSFNPASTTLAPTTANFVSSRTVAIAGGSSATYTVPSFTGGSTGLTAANNLTNSSGTVPTAVGSPVTLSTTAQTTAGTATFTINVTDAAGFTASPTYSLLVNPPIAVSPTPQTGLKGATAGTATDQTISVTGGTGPYQSVSVTFFNGDTTGLVPSNITTSNNNASPPSGSFHLLGIPTSAGNAMFTIQVVDTAGATLTQTYSLTVNPILSVVPNILNGAAVNVATDQTITISGGTKPYVPASFTVTSVLQTGSDNTSRDVTWATFTRDSVAGTIRLTGTPPLASPLNGGKPSDGLMTFDVNVTDTAGAQLTKHYTLSIFNFTPASFSPLDVGTTSADQIITITGGVKSYAVLAANAINSGGTGLSAANVAISANNGTVTLSATPNATNPGTFSFNLTVTDAIGGTFIKQISETVNAKPSITTLSLPDSNYYASPAYSQKIAFTGGTGTVTLSLTSGSLPTGLTFTPGTGVISGTPTVVGQYNFTITATDSLNATGSQAYTININKAHLTVTADNQSKPYNGSVFSPFTATLSGFVNGETALTAAGLTGSATFTTSPSSSAINAGVYTITPAAGTLSATNYDFPTLVNGTLTISKAHLTVTADNQSKTYNGSAFSPFTATLSGFVNGETVLTAAGLSGSAAFTGAATTAINAGVYTITPTAGTLVATNYDFTNLINGSLTISKVHLTVTADAKTRLYGASNPTFTATLTGFVNGETDAGLRGISALSGAATFSGTGPSSVGTTTVGNSYIITPAQGTLAATNYDFTPFVNGTLSITPAHLTVTADPQSRFYGAANPVFTATLSGFANGETDASLRAASALTGNAAFSGTGPSSTATTTVGNSYVITPALGTLSATNYDFTPFVNGTLTINKAHLTVTADAKTRVYGASNPTFTATLSGFVNGETDASLRGIAALSGAAAFSGTGPSSVATTTVGNSYVITPAIGTLAATNYDFTPFVNGTLAITQAHLTVTADAKTRIYGAANPTFTATLSGFVNGETALTAAGLTGSATFSGTGPSSTATTTVGNSYVITPALGTLVATNYDFTPFVNGTLSITPAHLTVTADAKTRLYGASNPTFTATLSGFVNGETDAGLRGISALTGTASFSGTGPSSVGTTPIGNSYVITPAQGTLAATNYDFTPFVNGTLSITPAHLTVTADPKSKTYDATPFTAFTATISGFANGETVSVVSGSAAFTTTPTPPIAAGTYTITPTIGTLSASNYDFPPANFITGTLTINKAGTTTVVASNVATTFSINSQLVTLNATVTSAAETVGTGTVTFSVLSSGGSPVTSSTVAAGSASVSFSIPASTGAGVYTIQAVYNPGSNLLTSTDSSKTLTINPPVMVTTVSLPDSTINVPYITSNVTATGGTGSKLFTVTDGALPTGLTLATSGSITGTPTVSGTFSVIITATDTVNSLGSQFFSFKINPAIALGSLAITANSTSVTGWTINQAGTSGTIAVSNGTPAYSTILNVTGLPAGLTAALSGSTITISGTPTVTASTSNNVSITVTDSVGAIGTSLFTVTVNPAVTISTASLPNSTLGVQYNQAVTAIGGTGAKTFAVTSGALPGGLSLSTAGVITGTSTAAGTFNFSITATDTVGAPSSPATAYTVVINTVLAISEISLPNGTQNTVYSQTLHAVNGTAPRTFAVTSGALPTGLSLNMNTGVISGTPTVISSYNFTVTATDAVNATASQAYTVVINPPLSVVPIALNGAAVGIPTNQVVTISGGTPNGAVKYASVTVTNVVVGTTSGLGTGSPTFTIDPSAGTVKLAGTPTGNGGVFSFDVNATDFAGALKTTHYSLSVFNFVVGASGTQFNALTVGAPTNQVLTITGGFTPYNAIQVQPVISGGTGLNASNLAIQVSGGTVTLSGTPTGPGTLIFDVNVIDASSPLNASFDIEYSVTVNPAPTITVAANNSATFSLSPQNVTLNSSVTSANLTVSSGTVTYTILNGATQIGSPVTTSTVANGSASAIFSIPGGTPAGTYTIQAVYNPGVNFQTSTDISKVLTVNAASTTTIAANQSTMFSAATQTVPLSATILSAAGTVAEGTVTFQLKSGAVNVGSAVTSSTVSGGSASVNYTLPASTGVATYTIVATYNPGNDYLTSSDNTKALTVNNSQTTLAALSTSATYSLSAQNVTLNATVSATNGGPINVGTVTFGVFNGAVQIGVSSTSSTVVNGAASVTYVLPAGTNASTYTIHALYNAGANFLTSSDNTQTLTVNPAATTLVASAASATYSLSPQNVTLSAAVTSAAGAVNVGTVSFSVFNGATQIGVTTTSGTVSNGVATATFNLPLNTAAGTYFIDASYNAAGTNFITSFDDSELLTVNNAATTLAASSASATYSLSAQNVSLSAAITSGAGTVNVGTVSFSVFNGGTQIGSTVTGLVLGGQASTTFSLPAGTAAATYSIQAPYNAGTNFLTSSDNTKSLTVNNAATTTVAAVASTTYSLGVQSVTLGATVTSLAGSVNVGTVSFAVFNGATQVGSTTISGTVTNGAASVLFSVPAGTAANPYTIVATYNAGTNFLGSSDNTKLLTISSAATTTVATNATATYNLSSQNLTLNATVSSAAGTVNVGTVTFSVFNGATQIGTSTTSGTVAAGAASVSFSIPAGTAANVYTIQTTYNAGANFNTSSDNTKTLTVNNATSTTVAVNANATYSLSAQNVTLTANVTSAAGAVNVGTVTFSVFNGGTQVGLSSTSGTVAAGAASAVYSLPAGTAAGTYSIQTTYNAGSNFVTSNDNSKLLTVSKAGSSTAVNANVVTTFSASAQNVTFNATVTSGAGVVNVGTVTFAVFNGATQIGVSTTSSTVTAGAASAVFSLPGGTAANVYSIQATYNPTSNFSGSADNSRTLTVSLPVVVNTSALANWTAGFAGYNQTVSASGGTGGLSYSTVTANLPPGLALSSGGVLSGTPNLAAARISSRSQPRIP